MANGFLQSLQNVRKRVAQTAKDQFGVGVPGFGNAGKIATNVAASFPNPIQPLAQAARTIGPQRTQQAMQAGIANLKDSARSTVRAPLAGIISTPRNYQPEFNPETKLEKFVLGNEPVKPIQQGTVSQTLQARGVKPQYANFAGGAALVGSIGSDLLPQEKAGKKLIEESIPFLRRAAKEKSITALANLAKRSIPDFEKFAPKAKQALLEGMKNAETEQAVKAVIDRFTPRVVKPIQAAAKMPSVTIKKPNVPKIKVFNAQVSPEEYLNDRATAADLMKAFQRTYYSPEVEDQATALFKKYGYEPPGTGLEYKDLLEDFLAQGKGAIKPGTISPAFGAVAGVEPEVDENGNPTGKMAIDPTKAALGVLGAGALKKIQRPLTERIFYHSSPNDFVKPKIDPVKGFSLTSDENFAKQWKGNNILQFKLRSNARIVDIKNLPKEIIDVTKGDGLGQSDWEGKAVQWARANGYDAIDMRSYGRKIGLQESEIKVVNPDAVERIGANKLVQARERQILGAGAVKKVQSPGIPGKTRGFIKNVRTNPMSTPEVAAGVKGTYTPRSTNELAMKARTLVNEDIGTARRIVATQTDEKAVAVASELIKKYQDAGDFDSAIQVANDIAPKLTELGRGVQAATIYGRITPEGILRFAQNEILKARSINPRLQIPDINAKQAEEFVNKTKKIQAMPEGREKALAVQKLMESVQDLVPSSFGQKALSLWKAGLLTGVKTTGTNVISNTLNATAETVKDLPAAVVDSVASLFTKKRTVVAPGSIGQVKAVAKGTREGVAKGWDYFKSGYDERNVGAKFDYKRVNFGKSKAAKALQAYEETIFRAIGSQDQPFFYGAKARSLYNQAQAAAKTQGLKGAQARQFIDNFVQSPSDEALELAVKDAEIAVFQNKTSLGELGSSVGRKGGPVGEFVVPFSRTPAAAAVQGLVNYTPVGAVKTIIQNIGKGKFDQRAFSQGLGRSITGTGVLAIGAALASAGKITGARPTSETERKQWELEGKIPNAIEINGKYRSVNALGSYGLLLVSGATYQRVLNETGSVSQAVTAAAAAGGRALTDSTFLTGVSNLTSALEDPARFGPSYAKSSAGSVIPTIVADTAKALDPYQRETNTIGDAVQNRIPVIRESNLPQRDVMGQPLQRDNALQSFADPFRPSPVRSNPVTSELSRLMAVGEKATPGALDAKQKINKKDVLLDPNQLNQLEISAGSKSYEVLNAIVSSPDYSKLTDNQRAKIISNVIDDIRATEKIRTSFQQGAISAKEAGDAVANLEKRQKNLILKNKLKIVAPKQKKEKQATQKQIDQTQRVLQPGAQTSDPLSKGLVSRALAAAPAQNTGIQISFGADDEDLDVQKAKFALAKDRAKRTNDLTAYNQAATEQFNALNASLEDLDPDSSEYYRTLNAIEDLTTEASKFEDYGGFKKPKKGKKPVTLISGQSINRDAYNDIRQDFQDQLANYNYRAEQLKRSEDPQGYLRVLGEEFNQLEQAKQYARTNAERTNYENKQADLIAEAQKIRAYGGFEKPKSPKRVNAPRSPLPKIKKPSRRARKAALRRPKISLGSIRSGR